MENLNASTSIASHDRGFICRGGEIIAGAYGERSDRDQLARRIAAALNAFAGTTTEEVESIGESILAGHKLLAFDRRVYDEPRRRPDEAATPLDGDPIRPPAPLVTVGDRDDDDRHL